MSAYKHRRCRICGKPGATFVPVLNQGHVHFKCWKGRAMTPEERAAQIAEGLGSFAAPIVKGWLIGETEKAIRAAVEEERERCARIADAVFEDGSAADLSRFYASVIAERIRNTNAPVGPER